MYAAGTGPCAGTLVRCVRNGGKVLVFGLMAAMTATVPIPDILFRDVSVRGFWCAAPFISL